MTSSQKIALALAASGVSIKELERVMLSIDRAERLELLRHVESLRRHAELTQSPFEGDSYRTTRYEAADVEPAVTIERMLRNEAGLSAIESVRLLSMEIHKRHPSVGRQLPPYSKNSFLDWVKRVTRVIPSSEVMHLAARIRNDIVHGKSDLPWDLRANRGDR